MNIKQEKNLRIKLTGSDVDKFKSGMKKLIKHTTISGFSEGSLTQEEKELFKKISEKL